LQDSATIPAMLGFEIVIGFVLDLTRALLVETLLDPVRKGIGSLKPRPRVKGIRAVCQYIHIRSRRRLIHRISTKKHI
jgi:hypothetical protein